MTRRRATDAAAAPDPEADGSRERTLREVEREAQALGAQLLGRERRTAADAPQERGPAPRGRERRTASRGTRSARGEDGGRAGAGTGARGDER